MRVTDLNKFSLEQVWRPFWPLFPGGSRSEHLTKSPYSLEETAELLKQDTEWSRLTLDRIRRIGVRFPRWIVHPLVDVVRGKH